ncbi:MAG TPA: ferritin-like domain-containing protein, partial [Polyangium sp.]|nr:ferritin-like domain-containing protein [Polyangium sp.]
MDHSLRFRKAFAARIASALGISLVFVGNVSGCGGRVIVDAGSGGQGGFGTGGLGTGGLGTGGNGEGGAGNFGGQGGFGGTTMSSVSSSSGNSMCDMSNGMPVDYLACMPRDSNGGCPDKANVEGPIRMGLDPCTCLRSVNGGPSPDPSGGDLCCYNVTVEFVCVVGRVFSGENGPLVAPLEASERGWSNQNIVPCTTNLSPAEREILAERWIRDGLFEHASIASFSRLALALLATSADAELIRAAHEAALDEVRHAQLSLSLAAAYRGEAVAPQALPMPQSLPVDTDLTQLAVASVIEGAVGETLAAVLAAEQAAVAEDPAVRQVLLRIADDESRHAELAFRVIAFAIAAGGSSVRDAVAHAFAHASTRLPAPPEDPNLPE